MTASPEERPLPLFWDLVGRVFRSTPHFKDKWRVVGKLVGRFVRGRGYTTLVRFDCGQRMAVNLDDWIQYQVFLTGFYDVETVHTRWFRRLVREGMTVFDVGANVGYYTLQAAARVGPRGQVHAFEPVSITFQKLLANLRLNDFRNVVANRCSVSDREGHADLYLADPSNLGASSIYPIAQGQAVERVPSITLDTYVEQAGLPAVHVVKIDVEGSELAVLRGMTGVLRRSEVQLLVEVSERTLKSEGAAPADLVEYLRPFGFSPFRITRRGPTPMAPQVRGKESLVLFRKAL